MFKYRHFLSSEAKDLAQHRRLSAEQILRFAQDDNEAWLVFIDGLRLVLRRELCSNTDAFLAALTALVVDSRKKGFAPWERENI